MWTPSIYRIPALLFSFSAVVFTLFCEGKKQYFRSFSNIETSRTKRTDFVTIIHIHCLLLPILAFNLQMCMGIQCTRMAIQQIAPQDILCSARTVFRIHIAWFTNAKNVRRVSFNLKQHQSLFTT